MLRGAAIGVTLVLLFLACSSDEDGATDTSAGAAPGTGGSGESPGTGGTGGSGESPGTGGTGESPGTGGYPPVADAATDQPTATIPDGGCVPGAYYPCTCADGGSGVNQCNTFGTGYLGCDCGEVDLDASTDAPACVGIGEPCANTVCCQGTCRDDPPYLCCFLQGCTGPGQCCNLTDCHAGQCCSDTGGSCGAIADCCSGYVERCLGGVCCRESGQPCSLPADCCSGS